MTKLTNQEMWNLLRTEYPNFASVTSKATKEMFTEAGFEALKRRNPEIINDFFYLSVMTHLDQINIASVKDGLSLKDFGAEVLNPHGGYLQRISIDSLSEVSPGYLRLMDGDSPDQFVVRKASTQERFFTINDEFQNVVTIPDEIMYKNMFVSDTGMSEYVGGMIVQLENSYKKHLYLAKLEVLNAGLNSTETPLKETQKFQVAYSDENTGESLANIVLAIKNIVSLMDAAPSSASWNAMGFDSAQDITRLRVLVRPGFRNEIAVKLLSGAYNPDQLTLPAGVSFVEVNNFGGLQPYEDEDFTIPLYEVYNKLGSVIGYSNVEESTEVTVNTSQVKWKDPNENILALIADKDLIFTARQGNYSVEPARNARGLYTNYWASAPRGTVAYDALFNVVVLEKAEETKKL